jgi:hypothetical protein
VWFEFAAADLHFRRGLDAHPNPIAVNPHDRLPGQHQHDEPPCISVSTASNLLSVRCEWLNFRTIDQLGRLKPFSAGTIEKDLVPIRFPDGGELGGARSVQAEVDPARLVAPPQDPFRHWKRPRLELILIANRRVDVVPKIFHTVDLLKTSQHF